MFLESALVYGGLLGLRHVVFYSPWIFKFPPELWRLCTAFLLTGDGFNFFIDLYFSLFYQFSGL
jgi:Derlin-2/3